MEFSTLYKGIIIWTYKLISSFVFACVCPLPHVVTQCGFRDFLLLALSWVHTYARQYGCSLVQLLLFSMTKERTILGHMGTRQLKKSKSKCSPAYSIFRNIVAYSVTVQPNSPCCPKCHSAQLRNRALTPACTVALGSFGTGELQADHVSIRSAGLYKFE